MKEFKPLDQEETIKFLNLAKQGDNDAKETLLQGNFPLIKSIVKNYQGKGVDYDDLYQIGCLGFLKAINNFDQSFGVKFSTYAVPMISGEIKRFLRDDGTVKVSRAIKTLWLKIKAYMDECEKLGKDLPSIEELAKHFEVEPDEVVVELFVLSSESIEDVSSPLCPSEIRIVELPPLLSIFTSVLFSSAKTVILPNNDNMTMIANILFFLNFLIFNLMVLLDLDYHFYH